MKQAGDRRTELVVSFVCFSVNNALWAGGLAWIREVVRPSTISPLPGSPSYLAGMINVRGDVIPVFNGSDVLCPGGRHVSASRFGESVIVFSFNDELFGMKVDQVRKVVSVRREDIFAVKQVEGGIAAVFAGGVIEDQENERIIVLNTENLLLFFRKERRKYKL